MQLCLLVIIYHAKGFARERGPKSVLLISLVVELKQAVIFGLLLVECVMKMIQDRSFLIYPCR